MKVKIILAGPHPVLTDIPLPGGEGNSAQTFASPNLYFLNMLVHSERKEKSAYEYDFLRVLQDQYHPLHQYFTKQENLAILAQTIEALRKAPISQTPSLVTDPTDPSILLQKRVNDYFSKGLMVFIQEIYQQKGAKPEAEIQAQVKEALIFYRDLVTKQGFIPQTSLKFSFLHQLASHQ